ncbi:MAG: NAD-dependent epimerase/dehydratase family protein, partial [Thermodesulfovibrionales bacterium]
MNILITGNMGYVGPLVVKRLRSSYPDAILIGFDTGFFERCITNRAISPDSRVDIQHFCDVRKIQDKILDGIDAIVHLAAISNDPMGNTFEEVTYDINYKSTLELAKKAKIQGVKSFVYASSCSMYGYAEDGPRTESSPLNPLTAYARSKVMSEEGLKRLADRK